MVDVARGSDLNLSKAARDKLAEEESEQEWEFVRMEHGFSCFFWFTYCHNIYLSNKKFYFALLQYIVVKECSN